MYSIKNFAQFLINNAQSISTEIVNFNIEKLEIDLPVEIIESSITTNRDFLEFLGNTISLTEEEVAKKFVDWLKKYQEQSQQYQEQFETLGDIETLIKPYADTRLQLIKKITKIAINQGLTTEEVVFVNNRISYLMDISITQTIIVRERISSEKMKENQKVINELSSPIVPIQNGMAILPLVGEFDCDKNNHILNYVIPKIRELELNCLIIDFSGIVNIDTEVASRIFDIYNTLTLFGINTIYTGIRSELAIRITNAGIDFSSLKIFATVQQAIAQ